MALQPKEIPPAPQETRRVAQSPFPHVRLNAHVR